MPCAGAKYFRVAVSTSRMPQNQSQSIYFFWRACPHTPLKGGVLKHTPHVKTRPGLPPPSKLKILYEPLITVLDGGHTQTITVPDQAHTQTITVPDQAHTQTITVPDQAHTQTITVPDGAYTQTITVSDQAHTQTITVSDGAHTQTITVSDGAHTQTITVSDGAHTQTITVSEGAHTQTITVSDGGSYPDHYSNTLFSNTEQYYGLLTSFLASTSALVSSSKCTISGQLL